MKEPPLKDNEIQLTDEYRVSGDQFNITLTKRYQKSATKGKNAEKLDEYEYGNAKFYPSIDVLIDSLVSMEVKDSFGKVKELKEISQRIEQLKDEVKKHIHNHVTIVRK